MNTQDTTLPLNLRLQAEADRQLVGLVETDGGSQGTVRCNSHRISVALREEFSPLLHEFVVIPRIELVWHLEQLLVGIVVEFGLHLLQVLIRNIVIDREEARPLHCHGVLRVIVVDLHLGALVHRLRRE